MVMTVSAGSASTKIRYILQFDRSHTEKFDIVIDNLTGRSSTPLPNVMPEWAKLDFEKCPNCPLDTEETENCPTAVALVDIARRVGNVVSHSEVELVVISEERWVGKKTTTQEAISSLMGLKIATSACPHTDYLKPMARFHLPLATAEETLTRITGGFLLHQYFKAKRGDTGSLNLSNLAVLYSEMSIVNSSIARRLRASGEFSELNALTILDTFAQVIPLQIEDRLDEIQTLFEFGENK